MERFDMNFLKEHINIENYKRIIEIDDDISSNNIIQKIHEPCIFLINHHVSIDIINDGFIINDISDTNIRYIMDNFKYKYILYLNFMKYFTPNMRMISINKHMILY